LNSGAAASEYAITAAKAVAAAAGEAADLHSALTYAASP
jgi:hypothetical protein